MDEYAKHLPTSNIDQSLGEIIPNLITGSNSIRLCCSDQPLSFVFRYLSLFFEGTATNYAMPRALSIGSV